MAVPIATRRSWGARYDDGDQTLTGLAVEVFAHHSVTAQLSPTASVEAEREQMRAIESVGQSRFGTGISYNVLIFPSGRAYQGVSWNRRGTHTGGRNSTARSICFAGNYETNKPTAAQLATAAAIYAEGKGKWWKTTAPLYGHRDVKGTACPGKYVYEQLPAIKAGTITLTPTGGFMADLTEQEKDKFLADVAAIRTAVLAPIKDGDGAAVPRVIAERTLAGVRSVRAAQLADAAVPVEVDVDANDVADALLERLTPAVAQSVADVLATRLAQ